MLKRIPMIDWFKAVGIFLIVFGHLDGALTNELTAPVMLKQIGVVFFVFIMGWQLSQEKRKTRLILIKRIYKIFFWGLLTAFGLSIIMYIFKGDINESNYLPFMAGVNVCFNYFPANPTTWYIGTYFHLLVVWALVFRKIKITGRLVVISFIVEVILRAIIMKSGLYRSYMLIFNWQTVFIAGMYMGNWRIGEKIRVPILKSGLMYAGFICLWMLTVNLFTMSHTFPFRIIETFNSDFSFLITSILISLVYVGHACFFFFLAQNLPDLKLIRFFSNNSLIIFLVHMPIWYAISPFMKMTIAWHPIRIIADLAILFVGLGIFSNFLRSIIPSESLQQFLLNQFCKTDEN